MEQFRVPFRCKRFQPVKGNPRNCKFWFMCDKANNLFFDDRGLLSRSGWYGCTGDFTTVFWGIGW